MSAPKPPVRSTTVPVEFTSGRAANYPVASTLSAPPISSVFGLSTGQVSAFYNAPLSISVPAATAGQFQVLQGKIALTAPTGYGTPLWPLVLQLKTGQSATAFVSMSLAAPNNDLLVGMPYLSLTFATGSPVTPVGALAISAYTLYPGRTYAVPALAYSLVVQATQTYTLPITLNLTAWAVLLAFPTTT